MAIEILSKDGSSNNPKPFKPSSAIHATQRELLFRITVSMEKIAKILEARLR
jgi:hypothetical protein